MGFALQRLFVFSLLSAALLTPRWSFGAPGEGEDSFQEALSLMEVGRRAEAARLQMIRETLLMDDIREVTEEISKRKKEGAVPSKAKASKELKRQLERERKLLERILSEIERIKREHPELARLREELERRQLEREREELEKISSEIRRIKREHFESIASSEYLTPEERVDLFADEFGELMSFGSTIISQMYVNSLKAKLIQSGTASQRERMWDREYRNAMRYYNSGHYKLAAEKLERMFRLYLREDERARFYLAESQYAIGLFDDAESNYRKVLDLRGSFAGDAAFRLMYLAYSDSSYGRVIELYESSSELLPGSENAEAAYLIAAQSYIAAGRYGDARNALGRIGKGSKLYDDALLLTARSYIMEGDLSSALETLEAIPRKSPLYHEASLAKGHISYELGDFDGAISYYGEIPRGSRFYPEALIGLTWAYTGKGDYEKALSAAERLLREARSDKLAFEAMALSGQNEKILGRYDEAENRFKEMIRSGQQNRIYLSYVEDRIKLESMINEAENLRALALERRDREAYMKAESIIKALRSSLVAAESFDSRLRDIDPAVETNGRIALLHARSERLSEALREEEERLARLRERLGEINRRGKRPSVIVKAEFERDVIEDMLALVGQLKRWVEISRPPEKPADVERWEALSHFGLADVVFSRNEERRRRLNELKRELYEIESVLPEEER